MSPESGGRGILFEGMKKEQKIVAVGALSGIAGMALLVFFLYGIFPDTDIIGTTPERIVFAFQMNLFAAIPLLVMIASVGNARFMSDAIDPTKHAENKKMEIDGRVVDNTLQQNFLFLVGTLALATVIPPESTKILGVLATVFVLARIAFWVGYRKNPLYRAPGMAATSYMNLGIMLFTLYSILI